MLIAKMDFLSVNSLLTYVCARIVNISVKAAT
jgi:hypothetical protein